MNLDGLKICSEHDLKEVVTVGQYAYEVPRDVAKVVNAAQLPPVHLACDPFRASACGMHRTEHKNTTNIYAVTCLYCLQRALDAATEGKDAR